MDHSTGSNSLYEQTTEQRDVLKIDQSIHLKIEYKVLFSNNIFELNQPLLTSLIENDLGKPKKLLVVIDAGVAEHHSDLVKKINKYCRHHDKIIQLCDQPLILPGGEEIKNQPEAIEKIHQKIHKNGICRQSYILAIGGGALLDLTGYAAATAHRGIRLIRVPTTVLSQNDSGVGVKNGINYFGKKNFLGTFAAPYAVINDSDFLTTLTDRDWRSGLAEAVKVSLIRDASFFNMICEHASSLTSRDMDAMNKIIFRCAKLHAEHISQGGDPFELGSSRPLDFGHWSAHKLEKLSNYSLRHGEAVAMGIALDATYSNLIGFLEDSKFKRIITLLKQLGFKLYDHVMSEHLDDPDHPESLFKGLIEFREHLGGILTLMMLKDIGQGHEVNEVKTDIMQKAVLKLKQLN